MQHLKLDAGDGLTHLSMSAAGPIIERKEFTWRHDRCYANNVGSGQDLIDKTEMDRSWRDSPVSRCLECTKDMVCTLSHRIRLEYIYQREETVNKISLHFHSPEQKTAGFRN